MRASPAGLGRPFVENLLACRDDFSDVAKFFCRLSRRGLVGLPGGFSRFVGKNFSVWRKVLVQTEGDICRLGKRIRKTGGSDGGCLPHGRGVRPPEIVACVSSNRGAHPVATGRTPRCECGGRPFSGLRAATGQEPASPWPCGAGAGQTRRPRYGKVPGTRGLFSYQCVVQLLAV